MLSNPGCSSAVTSRMLTGIDLQYTVLMEKYSETNHSDDMPSPAIVERYALKEYGRKTGQGFYQYDAEMDRP